MHEIKYDDAWGRVELYAHFRAFNEAMEEDDLLGIEQTDAYLNEMPTFDARLKTRLIDRLGRDVGLLAADGAIHPGDRGARAIVVLFVPFRAGHRAGVLAQQLLHFGVGTKGSLAGLDEITVYVYEAADIPVQTVSHAGSNECSVAMPDQERLADVFEPAHIENILDMKVDPDFRPQ